MKDEELEKTKPIGVLSELSRSTKYEETPKETREEKYQEIEKEDMEDKEALEEALAEKNIREAEAIIEAENNDADLVTPEVVVKDKKDGLFKKIGNKWSNLSKMKKTLIIVIIILFIVIIATITTMLVLKNKKVEEPPKKNEIVEEEAPVITDNFYFRDGKLYFTDEAEEVLGNYECENKDSNLCYVAYNSFRDNFDVVKLQDEAGNEIISRMDIYEDRYVFIIDNSSTSDKTVKLFSMTDNKLVGTYNSVKAFDDNYIIVEDKNGSYGLLQIDDGVKEIISDQYEYLGMIDGEENLIAKNKKGYVVINKSNKVLSSPLPSNAQIKSYNNNMVVISIGNEYSVYDYKADLIASGYTYASLKDEYVALVDSTKHLTIRGMDKTKYNEGSISLDTTNYVKTYVYDTDGNLKKVKRSYELNIKSEVIEIGIYDSEDDVAYENLEFVYGKANKKYQYLNYFNGKLYFYKDLEKEELLGSYTCSNKNYIASEEDYYGSCFPARDTVYETNDMTSYSDLNKNALTPLINSNYVFISDGSNTVKLYDLKQNKTLSTYSSVNTYTKDNGGVFNLYNGNIEVVGQNKKGEFGVLSFDDNGVSAKYLFEYAYVEKIGNYYIMSEDDNTSYIKYTDGKSSVTFNGKVMGYTSDLEYFKVMRNKKYSVVLSNGKEINDSTYDYVELYDEFFAGVNDKKISIYDYEGNLLTNDTVPMTSYPYSKGEYKGIKVTKNSDSYTVNVYDGKEYQSYTLELIKDEEDE